MGIIYRPTGRAEEYSFLAINHYRGCGHECEYCYVPDVTSQKCFATHGFDKSEVYDVWWNSKLEIMMNRKTAAEIIDQAVNEIMLETLLTTARSK